MVCKSQRTGSAPSAITLSADFALRAMASTRCCLLRWLAAAPPTKPDAPVMKICMGLAGRVHAGRDVEEQELEQALLRREVRLAVVRPARGVVDHAVGLGVVGREVHAPAGLVVEGDGE